MPPTTVAIRSLSGAGVRGERVGDLLGQLTGRHEDQGQRLPGLGALSGGAGQQRQAEGEGLAGAGAAAAQDVPAGQRVRQGRAPGSGTATVTPSAAERRQQLRGHVEIGERLDGGQRRRDGHRQRELTLRRGGPAAVAAGAAGRPERRGADEPKRLRGPLLRGAGGAATGAGVAVVRASVRFMQNLPRCGTYQGIPAAVSRAENRKNGPRKRIRNGNNALA